MEEYDLLLKHLGELEMGRSMNCLSALIKYMKILADDTNFGRFKLERFQTSQYMRMDWTVIRALELFSTSYSEQCLPRSGARR